MKWLSIIGVSDSGVDTLTKPARQLLDDASVLVSSNRIFKQLEDDNRPRIVWGSDFKSTLDQVLALKPRKVCILATGDPMFLGIGCTLARYISADETIIIPAPSIFSLICAKLMWSQQEAEAVSVHGRDLNSLIRYLRPGARLVVLSHDGQTPDKVAKLLCHSGYPQSTITVFEHLGANHEKITTTTARECSLNDIAAFNSLAIDCVADHPTVPVSRSAGIRDDFYHGDGVMTKKHIRALTLSSLAPAPKALLWDIGAGAGTIAIEWLRSMEHTQAYAVEQQSKRVENIKTNANALGVPELNTIESTASHEILDGLPDPDAVFIGGGSSDYELIKYCWHRLKTGGRLVINAVSIEAEHNMIRATDEFGGHICRISVEHLHSLGGHQAFKPERTVTHYYIVKGQPS